MNLLKRITYKEPFTTNENPHRSARVVLLDDDNKVAVIYVAKVNFYTLPGGGIEEGETPEQAAIREMKEETGCNSEIIRTLGLIEENSKTMNWNGLATCFMSKVKGSKGTPHLTQEEIDEDAQLQWHDMYEALNIITNQDADDGIRLIIQERDVTLLNEAIKLLNEDGALTI